LFVVSNRRTRRIATTVAALASFVALAGCGAPSNLDHQEQIAFARACTSLIERNIVQADPPIKDLSNGQELNLDDPTAFYAALLKLRGPDTFDFHKPADAAASPKDKLDAPCRLTNASHK
jgi:hypothetical protein